MRGGRAPFNLPLTIVLYVSVNYCATPRSRSDATTMSTSRPHSNRPSRRLRLLALACGTAAFFTGEAGAQIVPDLRGTVGENPPGVVTRSAQAARSERQAPGYRPVSPGAIPEEAQAGADADAIFAEPPLQVFEPEEPVFVPVIADDDEGARAGRVEAENRRLDTVEGGGLRGAQDDAYAAPGIRAGTFILRPVLEQGIGRTSNASSSAGGRASTYSQTGLRLDGVSDWSRHSAAFSADGTFRRSLSGARISEARGGVEGRLRLDLIDGYVADASLGYRAAPESASSPVDIGDVAEQPLRHTITGGLGLSRQAGKVRLGLRGEAIRQIHDDADLVGGGRLDQSDRDSTLATLSLRAGYELSPAIVPFVEVEAGRRYMDNRRDAAGFERSADRFAALAGVELDLGDKLRGEISAGWLTERPDDPRLRDISAPYAAASLVWSPEQGTTLALTASTTVETTTAPCESGSVLYGGTALLTRELRSNLTATAQAGVEWRDFCSTDNYDITWHAEAGLTYWLNPYSGISGRLRYEEMTSDMPGRDYDETSAYLGMIFRR